ncbi:MAG: hypothetical protein AB1938_01615 [Myxococcota bacterium]
MRVFLWWCALASVAAGCSCSSPMMMEDSGPPPMPDANDVRGDFVDRYLVNDGGLVLVPQQLTGRTLSFFVEEDDGGFDIYGGVGADDGTFYVIGLPEGTRYTLQLGNVRVNTDARVLHLGSNSLGRPDTFQADRNEGLALYASNLSPWTEEDEVQVHSWNAGIGYYSTSTQSPPFAAGAPDAGDTTLDGGVLDFEGEGVPEAARGDDLMLLQLHGERSDAGVLVKTAVRALPASTTLMIGTPTPLAGDFVTLPLKDGRFTLNAPEFTRHGALVGPGAQPFVARFLVDAHPGAFGRTTHTGGTPDLAVVELPPDAGLTPLSFQYGNPFPSTWTPFVSAGALYDLQYTVALPDGGTSFARSELGFVSVALLEDAAAAGPVAPLVTPPRDVKLNGELAAVPLTGVSTTPEVSWTAPATGTVKRVEIDVVKLEATMIGGTRRVAAGTLRVVGAVDHVRLPPGMLNPGGTYYLRVTALSLPDTYDPTWPLLDVGPPAGAASASTAAFTTRP